MPDIAACILSGPCEPLRHRHHAGCVEAFRNVPTLTSVPIPDDRRREISRAAKQVTSWTERRNKLIREEHEAGAGIRELARASGLNEGTVHTMLYGRKR